MVVFWAYWRSLMALLVFKYLGRVLTTSNDNWPEVVDNLMKARKRWEKMSRYLVQEGADPRTPGEFYNSLVQVTLLFDSDSWMMSPRVGITLGGFHHRVSHRL